MFSFQMLMIASYKEEAKHKLVEVVEVKPTSDSARLGKP